MNREEQAANNRRDFTAMAEALIVFAEFSPRPIYAEENGRSIGKKPQDDPNSLDGDRLVAMYDATELTKQLINKRLRK